MKKRLRKKLGRWNAKEWYARGFVPVSDYVFHVPLFDEGVFEVGSLGGRIRLMSFSGPYNGGGSRKALREFFNAGTTPGGNAVQNDAP